MRNGRWMVVLGICAAVLFGLGIQSQAQPTPSGSVLWNFGAAADDSLHPQAGLLRDFRGNLYGTTVAGGAGNYGAVFELTPPRFGQSDWSETVLYSFGTTSNDGQNPYAQLARDFRGNIYGTTFSGGASGYGTVFELRPPRFGQSDWSETILYSLGTTTNDGQNPQAGLISDQRGNFYGTTRNGGDSGFGTVFELSPPRHGQTDWSETVLYSFKGSLSGDGQSPIARLVMDRRGNLYGTTVTGGSGGYGTVFELSPPAHGQSDWSETVLHVFKNSPDGANPFGGLVLDRRGNLYGTTTFGGVNFFNAYGTVFELSPPAHGQTDWTETVLHNFPSSAADGAEPGTGLIIDRRGNLYGTTGTGSFGTPLNDGTVFELSPPQRGQTDWTETVLYGFTGSNGNAPGGDLIMDFRGNLYGTTIGGGTNNGGTVFEISH
jgi:uncharacterized repeat protein (TIGR03803 family)